MSPCTLQLHNDLSPMHPTAASQLLQISIMDAPTRTHDPCPCLQPTTLSIDVHVPNSPAIYAAMLTNEHTGFNLAMEKSKASVLMDEDLKILSSTNDDNDDMVLNTMSTFINDACYYWLIDNHCVPISSYWDENCLASNMDKSHFQLIQ